MLSSSRTPKDIAAATWSAKGNGLAYFTKNTGECDTWVVQEGDEVWITHAGLNEQGRQFDGNVADELLKVVIGQRRVIQGMEQGMIGQCLTETRLIRMPPHFAYDDPNLKFSSGRKPVPPGSTVLYQITIHEIRRPGTFSYYWVLAVQEGGVPGLVALLIALAGLYVFYDGHVKKMKRGGSKKRR